MADRRSLLENNNPIVDQIVEYCFQFFPESNRFKIIYFLSDFLSGDSRIQINNQGSSI